MDEKNKTKIFTNTNDEIKNVVKEELLKKDIVDNEFREKLISNAKKDINIKIECYKKNTVSKTNINKPSNVDWSKLSWAYQNI